MGRGWGHFRGSKRLQVGPNQSSVPMSPRRPSTPDHQAGSARPAHSHILNAADQALGQHAAGAAWQGRAHAPDNREALRGHGARSLESRPARFQPAEILGWNERLSPSRALSAEGAAIAPAVAGILEGPLGPPPGGNRRYDHLVRGCDPLIFVDSAASRPIAMIADCVIGLEPGAGLARGATLRLRESRTLRPPWEPSREPEARLTRAELSAPSRLR